MSLTSILFYFAVSLFIVYYFFILLFIISWLVLQNFVSVNYNKLQKNSKKTKSTEIQQKKALLASICHVTRALLLRTALKINK